MAHSEGNEPSLMVLETIVLPLNDKCMEAIKGIEPLACSLQGSCSDQYELYRLGSR